MLIFPMNCLACLGAIPNGLAAGALLGAVITTNNADSGLDGNGGHVPPAVGMETRSALETGVDFEVLGGGALQELDQAEGDQECGEDELEEPIQIQRESQNMHAMQLSPRS